MPKLLYHYCSVEAFFQIITNQTLRLTNIQYMNDKNEIHYGLDILEELDKTYQFDADKKMRNYINIYAMCFSEEGDLLSQWRAYGDNTEGVSIGFDFSILKKEDDLHIPRDNKSNAKYFHSLNKIIYDQEEQENQIKEFINYKNKTPFTLDNHTLVKKWGNLVSELKDPTFDEEKEWRLISALMQGTATEIKDENLSFYVTNKMIVPYIDRKFQDLFEITSWDDKPYSNSSEEEHKHFLTHLCPIKHIIIGSSCKLDQSTLHKFLNHNAMPFIERDMKIENSKIPYRNK